MEIRQKDSQRSQMAYTSISRSRLFKWLPVSGLALFTIQFLLSKKYESTNVRVLFNRGVATGNILRGNLSDDIFALEDTQKHDTALANKSHPATTSTELTKKPSLHEGHNGFELAMKVNAICNTTANKGGAKSKKLFSAPRERLVYCPVEKVGTTFWRRTMYMLTGPNKSKFTNPYDVPIGTALGEAHYYANLSPIQTQKAKSLMSDNSFKFYFVRNPYSRLLSVFVDKLVPPNPTYWKAFGVKAISSFRKEPSVKSRTHGYDVTFSEFVKHVTKSVRTHTNSDVHFQSATESCTPCTNKFNYIGRMESFGYDAMFIFNKLHMNSTVDTLTKHLKNLTTDDAITDSVRSPFGWKRDVVKIISWDTALRRVWLKLQIRGIIGLEQTFPLTIAETNNITVDEFINLARVAHKRSVPSQLKEQKRRAMKEAFDSLSLDDLNAFTETFIKDFQYYGYEERPVALFDNRSKEAAEPKVFFADNSL